MKIEQVEQAGRAEKVNEKNVLICVVFTFPFRVMILKLWKKVHFFNIALISSKKSKYAKAITYMHLKGLAFSKCYCLLCYDLMY